METISLKKEKGEERSREEVFVAFVDQMRLFPKASVIFWLEEFGDEELYEHDALPEALRLMDNKQRPSVVFHLSAGEMPRKFRSAVVRLAKQGRVPSMSTDDAEFFMQIMQTAGVVLPSISLIQQIELENFDTVRLVTALDRFITTNVSSTRIELERISYNADEREPLYPDRKAPKRFIDWVVLTLPGLIAQSAGTREVKLGMVNCISYDFYSMDECPWAVVGDVHVTVDLDLDTIKIFRLDEQ